MLTDPFADPWVEHAALETVMLTVAAWAVSFVTSPDGNLMVIWHFFPQREVAGVHGPMRLLLVGGDPQAEVYGAGLLREDDGNEQGAGPLWVPWMGVHDQALGACRPHGILGPWDRSLLGYPCRLPEGSGPLQVET